MDKTTIADSNIHHSGNLSSGIFPERVCTRCDRRLPESEFVYSERRKDLKPWCRQCEHSIRIDRIFGRKEWSLSDAEKFVGKSVDTYKRWVREGRLTVISTRPRYVRADKLYHAIVDN
ncbi:MAG: hypothetical protein JRJ62_16035 [Deltaproteobacteria bacterium]|nr:hypothetical protein [Deltaproteobacteria bacterium]